MERKLYLSATDKKVAGVCGGIAEYFHFESSLVRIVFVLLALLLKMTPVILYIILWAVLPRQEF